LTVAVGFGFGVPPTELGELAEAITWQRVMSRAMTVMSPEPGWACCGVQLTATLGEWSPVTLKPAGGDCASIE
jgi:hypothetical protein